MDNLPMGSMPLEDVTVSATNATQPPDIRRGRSMNRLALTRSWAVNWSWSVGLLAILLTVIGGLALVSDAFAQAPQPPARPTGLVIDSFTDSAVTISWDDPADPSITGYEILRRHFGVDDWGVFHTIQDDTGTNAVSYTDTTVEAGESYVYRVKAINAAGRSQRSSYARADLPETPVEDDTLTLIDKGDNSDTRRQDAVTTLAATLTGTSGSDVNMESSLHLLAQVFSTGSNSSGYDLSSVGVVLGATTDPPSGQLESLTITAKLYEAPSITGALSLGTEVCTLTSPASITKNVPTGRVATSFGVPQECGKLKASTAYAVAFERDSSSNVNIIMFRKSGTSLDSGAAAGWSGDGVMWESPSLGFNGSSNFRFEIKGTVVATNNAATGAPTISGDAELGSVLTAAPGDIADPDGLDNVSYSYQWLRSGAVIAGATAQRYYPSDADVGSTIEVEVSFEDDKNNPEERTSGSTSAVPVSATVTVPWSATMTAGRQMVLGDDYYGFNDATVSLSVMGMLDPVSFTIGAGTHTVRQLLHESNTPGVSFTVDKAVPVPFRLVHGQSGDLSSLNHTGTGQISGLVNYGWSEASSPWAEGDKVAVALVVPINFEPDGLPTITGTAQVGHTLTAAPGDIADLNGLPDTDTFTYRWSRVDSADNASFIAGARSSTYEPTADDVGHKLRVKVKFRDLAGYIENVDSEPTAVVTGDCGDALVCNLDEAVATPGVTVNNSNYRAQSFTTGASTGGYTVTAVDVEIDSLPSATSGISVAIYTAKANGDPSASVITLTNPAMFATGVNTFTAPANSTLDASTTYFVYVTKTGTDTDFKLSATASGSQTAVAGWTIADNRHSSANGSLWTDTGNPLLIAVKGEAVTATNNDATGAPTISGTAELGSVLTAGAGTIADTDGLTKVSYTYQWRRFDSGAWVDITGATAQHYYPSDADVGKTLSVNVSFTDDLMNAEVRSSTATALVPSSTMIKVPWSATMTVGKRVVGSAVGLGYSDSPAYGSLSATSFTLAGTSYTVPAFVHDSDHQRVYFEASPPLAGQFKVLHGASGEYSTANTAAVQTIGSKSSHAWEETFSPWAEGAVVAVALRFDQSAATGEPAITGTTTVGQTLTAAKGDIADANGLSDPLDNVAYQWIRVDGSDSDIPGATSSTYELQSADEGKKIKVRLTFDDRAGFSESRTSDATATIQASTAVRQVTGVSVPSPRATSAVAYVNVSVGGAATVHARWRLVGVVTWRTASQTVDASFDGAVEFSLAGLDPSSNYEIQASMNSGFTVVKTATFRTVESIEVCSRSMPVLISILRALDWSTWCGDITPEQLASITQLDLSHWHNGIGALRQGDFAGLTGLTGLYLNNNDIRSLPSGIFQDLSSLETLNLVDNNISTLNSGVFTGLTNLKRLWLARYKGLQYDDNTGVFTNTGIGTTIAADVFDPLTKLQELILTGKNIAQFHSGQFAELAELQCIHVGFNRGSLTQAHFTNNTKLQYLNGSSVDYGTLAARYNDPDGICGDG